MARAAAALLALAAALLAVAPAAAAPVPVKLGDFDSPMYLTAPPRDGARVFVAERAGVIELVKNGIVQPTHFLDLRSIVDQQGERGLLSMAFAPDYATSGLFYVFLTAKDPLGELQIREYKRSVTNPDVADPAGRIVLRQPHGRHSNHNGGAIQFGLDGMLWISTGDGGGSNDEFNHGQRLDILLGKLLRINPRRTANGGPYSVPADNPFKGPGDGAHDTIWASGLRNPFRFSFDRSSGSLLIGDVGQGSREEIDFARRADGLGRGADYGWRCFEGTLRTPGVPACEPRSPYLPPIFEYQNPPDGPRAVTGGIVVRDPGLPTLRGRYVYADFYIAKVRSLNPWTAGADDRPTVLQGAPATHLVAFGEDACGRVYLVSLDGPVHRLQDGAPTPCTFAP